MELPLGKSLSDVDHVRTMTHATAFAPGRVEILGNHTDYNGGVVLSAALHLGITATGRRLDDGEIRLSSSGARYDKKIVRGEGLRKSGD